MLKHSNTFFAQKRYDSALKFYRQYLQMQQGEDSSATKFVNSLDKDITATQRYQAYLKLAFCFNVCSLYDSALRTLESGLLEFRVSGIQNPQLEAKFFLQTGTTLVLKRDHGAALSWYQKCLLVTKGKGLTASEAYQNIGNICYFKADYENAIINYQKAWVGYLALKKRNPGLMFQTLASLGAAYIENGEPAKGLSCLQSAETLVLPIPSIDSVARAGLYLNIGSAFLKMKNPGSALFNYAKGLKFLEKGERFNKNSILVAYKGVAASYLALGNCDSSLFILREAEKAISLSENSITADIAGIQCMTGDVFMMKKDYDSAAAIYHSALNSLLKGFQLSGNIDDESLFHQIDQLELFMILEKNATALLLSGIRNDNDTGSLKQSFRLFMRAIAFAGKIQQKLGPEGSRLVFNDNAKNACTGAMEAAYRLWKSGMEVFRDTLFQLAEGARGKIMMADLNERQVVKIHGIPDSLIQRRNFLSHEIGLITRRKMTQQEGLYDSPGFSYWSDLEKLIDLNIENDSLIEKFERTIPGFNKFKNEAPLITSSGVQEKIPDDTVILEYFWADSSLYVFILSHESYYVQRIIAGKKMVSLIAGFQKSIKRADLQKFPVFSYDLYRQLLEPVRVLLGHKHHLIIIPDEELSSLPFEALVVQQPETKNKIAYPGFHYLVKDFEISYWHSSAAYLKPDPMKLSVPHSFLGSAPAFKTQQLQVPSFDPLESSLSEVSTIASLFRNNSCKARVLTQSEATKSGFLQLCGQYSCLHIATHSIMDETHPDQVGLVFSTEESEKTQLRQGNNILWRKEIENLDLSADLLVLSACATGKGKLTRTEGLVALPKSFYLAGAANILYTLWNIPDRQTKDFMISFYQGFLGGKTYSAALRDAKLKMIARPETALPYQWAGFVLLGK